MKRVFFFLTCAVALCSVVCGEDMGTPVVIEPLKRYHGQNLQDPLLGKTVFLRPEITTNDVSYTVTIYASMERDTSSDILFYCDSMGGADEDNPMEELKKGNRTELGENTIQYKYQSTFGLTRDSIIAFQTLGYISCGMLTRQSFTEFMVSNKIVLYRDAEYFVPGPNFHTLYKHATSGEFWFAVAMVVITALVALSILVIIIVEIVRRHRSKMKQF